MRILVCEDDMAICRIISVTLEPGGNTFYSANGADAACDQYDKALSESRGYDLIITDVVMPGPSGFSFAGYVRGMGYAGRLAFLTSTEIEIGNLATARGEYRPKPEALGNLVQRVEGRGATLNG